jgi:steroid delta-isomerase-like uncharacterized protein
MDTDQMQRAMRQEAGWRFATNAASVFVFCLALCLISKTSHAATPSLEELNKAVARTAFFEYLNHKDFKSFEAIHTKDFVKHYNNRAPEDLSQEMEDAQGQFVSSSDLTMTVNWMIAEGDKVAVYITAKGTHDGVFHGIPASGKKYEVCALTVWRFVNGKIAEEWVFVNDLDIYRQLGLFKDQGSSVR